MHFDTTNPAEAENILNLNIYKISMFIELQDVQKINAKTIEQQYVKFIVNLAYLVGQDVNRFEF